MRGGLSAFIAGWGEVEFMSLRKPYRSVDEQLRILRSRGMAVDAGAGHVLRREGYYPIVNGYKAASFAAFASTSSSISNIFA